jgi:hypothetical protein
LKLLETKIDTPEAKLWYLQLDKPRTARRLAMDGKPGGYVDVSHILVGVSDLTKEDEHGSFRYTETAILGTDETGAQYPIYLYFTQRALTLDEALWTIGETYNAIDA